MIKWFIHPVTREKIEVSEEQDDKITMLIYTGKARTYVEAWELLKKENPFKRYEK